MCKMCGTHLEGAWVDVRVGGVFRQLCITCSEKESPLLDEQDARCL